MTNLIVTMYAEAIWSSLFEWQ